MVPVSFFMGRNDMKGCLRIFFFLGNKRQIIMEIETITSLRENMKIKNKKLKVLYFLWNPSIISQIFIYIFVDKMRPKQ